MSAKTMGRPKADNPKNIDVKVRFDENTHKELLKYCDENDITRTEAIRNGVSKLMKLEKGLEYKDIKEYDEALKKFDKQRFIILNREEQKGEIEMLNKKLHKLYGLIEKVRDIYLDEEYNMSYEECFRESIEVRMPVDVNIFYLQKQFYNLIMELYEIIEIR